MISSQTSRMALFGGTFDPPHLAHLRLLKFMAEKFEWQKVIVIPSHFPPGKIAVAPYEKRLEWTQKVFSEPPFEVSKFEEKASHTLFARDIFYHYATFYPHSKFYWVLGEDQWAQLAYWKEIDEYAQYLEWIVMKRTEAKSSKAGLLSRRLLKSTCAWRSFDELAMPEVSSSEIRASLTDASKESLQWVPESIRNDVVKTYQSLTKEETR